MAYRARLKVRFGDIDHAGIVYYPRLLHYAHVAMEELFSAALGVEYAHVLDDRRLGLPAVHLEADFARPLRYGDVVEAEVAVERLGERSVTWRFRLFPGGDGEPAARLRVVTAAVDLDGFRSRSLPDWLRRALEPHLLAAAEEAG